MRQSLLIILTTFLVTLSFSQTPTKTLTSDQRVSKSSSEQENFSISVKDTLKYQFFQDGKNFKVDMGSINYGQQPVNCNFFIHNNSDSLLVITQAYWAEPAIAPQYDHKPITKGQNGLLTYRLLDTKRPGYFTKTANVKTNLGDFFISFRGINLPPDIFIDKPMKIETVKLGETIISEFKIYNKSADTSYKIENIQTNWKTTVTYDSDEVKKYENTIPPNSYRTFKVSYTPYKVGDSTSKISIIIKNGNFDTSTDFGQNEVDYYIFATSH